MSRFKGTKVFFETVSPFCTLLPVYEHRDFTDNGARAEDFTNRSSIPKAHRGTGRMDHFSITEVQQRMKLFQNLLLQESVQPPPVHVAFHPLL